MPTNKLFNKNFILLFQGQLFSQVGTLVYTVGLVFWLKKTTESATVISLFFIAGAIPSILLGPFGGAVADSYPRKKNSYFW